MAKRAAATTFTCFLPRNDRWRGKIQEVEEDQTQGKGDGYGQTELRLHTDKNTVAIQWNSGYILTELQFQPDGTKVTILMKL
ncbi:hypothetical protein [Phocaeicola sartorii]|uniref:hypothetical protein n=1 Tax=Phocaeicola sartorii TaxID=671267 RepID=UPI0013631BA3|nr:hypothetical protein [Phocaeicola sartorii]NBH66948.1 hypothetical protein [Phocaeicola sartorii]